MSYAYRAVASKPPFSYLNMRILTIGLGGLPGPEWDVLPTSPLTEPGSMSVISNAVHQMENGF